MGLSADNTETETRRFGFAGVEEALTQVIFRARAVLGRYAVHLLTARGVGLRIDTEVRVLEAITVGRSLPALGADATPQRRASDTAPPAPIANAPTTLDVASAAGTPSAASVLPAWAKRSPPWLWLGVIAVIISAIATISVIRRQVSTQPLLVDEGYGLVEADLHAHHPGTADMIREAFLNDARGERAQSGIAAGSA
ncbi:MAG: hypothetical protein SGI99_00615 [Pseudomonadota bacterium]|mgnify:CR=1 FL=1|nr:hypothetical protein [Pseudomonadota bacterium]